MDHNIYCTVCTSFSAIDKPIFYHFYNSKQQGLLSVSLLADLNSHAVSLSLFSVFLCLWQMNPVWRWTVFVTSHRLWPVTLSLCGLTTGQRYMLQICSNQTHETPSTRVSTPYSVCGYWGYLWTLSSHIAGYHCAALSCNSCVHLTQRMLTIGLIQWWIYNVIDIMT